MNMFAAVYAFQKKMGFPMPERSTELPREVFEFRARFLDEELQELLVAYEEHDLEKQFDALLDIVYVALGTALLMGLWSWDTGFKRVHDANMKKEPGRKESRPGSLPGYDCRKPDGWQAPVLRDLV